MGTVTVKDHAGQYHTVDKTELPIVLKHGFTVPSNEEIDDYNGQQEHGGIPSAIGAFAEEAASTASFGLTRELENITGLTTPEAQAARAKYNPIAHVAGIPAGLIADPFGAAKLVGKIGGKASQVAAKYVGKAPEGASLLARAARNIPAAAAGAAAEGAIYGAGQSVADHAMGEKGMQDPDLMAEHIASNIGYGSLIAGGLGAALEGGANIFKTSTLKGSMAEATAKGASYQSDINQAVGDSEEAAAQAMASQQAETLFGHFDAAPESLADIHARVKTNAPLLAEGMPSRGRLKEAVDELPDLQWKPHALQYESLTDQGMRDYYKTAMEGQSAESADLRAYEAHQKGESVAKLDNTINDMVPGLKPESDAVKAGDSAVKSFVDQYQTEKKELAPLFKKFDDIAGKKNVNSFQSVANLQDIFPEIGEFLKANDEAKWVLDKFIPSMPFSKNTYGAIKDLVMASNRDALSLAGLRNVRESMRDRLTLMAAPRDDMHIGQIRKMLMDQMQEAVEKAAPDLSVRETFKRYAMNEERRGVIEKILGGSISDRASFAKTIKPEDVLSKLFSNTVSVKAAKEILGKDFGKISADYLAMQRAKVTDEAKNGFSSNKFSTFLKGKQPELAEALNPLTHNRLKALTDYMRILPDSPSVNPSGTAGKLGIMERIAGISKSLKPGDMLNDFLNKYASKLDAERQKFTMNEVLAGKHFSAAKEAGDEAVIQSSKLAKLERLAENTAYEIKKGVSAVFDTSKALARKSLGVIGSKLAPHRKQKDDTGAELEKHHDVFAKIEDLQENPEKLMDAMGKATAAVYAHDPALAQSLQVSMARANRFLYSKLPPRIPPSPISQMKYNPSKQEIRQFERYYNIVEDPVLALHQIKTKTLTPETIETLVQVHPKLFQQMQFELMDASSKEKNIPYQTRQMISMFMGAPLDRSLDPMNVLQTQSVFTQPQQATPQFSTSKSKMTIAERTGLGRDENS